MALARIVDEKGESVAGSRGLSLFYVEIKNRDGSLNGIEVLRLKDKLGTKALPTAELKLVGVKAQLVGVVGEGVKQISSMFNVTRLYNSVTSIAALRRILVLAEDYSSKRFAFDKMIADHVLNAELLKEARSQLSGCFHFTFFVAEIFGHEEVFHKENPLGLTKDELSKIFNNVGENSNPTKNELLKLQIARMEYALWKSATEINQEVWINDTMKESVDLESSTMLFIKDCFGVNSAIYQLFK